MLKKIVRKLIAAWQMITDPVGYAKRIGVKFGDDCRFISLSFATFGSEPYLIRLGNHVTVTEGVRFITHDGGVWIFRHTHPDIDVFGKIVVGNNVFIGAGAIIMPGVTIGDHSVIGAGAVVTHDIPSGYVAVGVPAKPVKTIEEYWANIQDRRLL